MADEIASLLDAIDKLKQENAELEQQLEDAKELEHTQCKGS